MIVRDTIIIKYSRDFNEQLKHENFLVQDEFILFFKLQKNIYANYLIYNFLILI